MRLAMRRACGMIAALCAGAAYAEDLKPLTFVQMHPVIGVGEEVFLYAVPKQLGWFKDEGLDVRIQGAPSGAVAAQVIQVNGAQLGTTAPESVIQMREQGGDLVAIYGLKRNAGTFVIVMDQSPIHDLADLKGRTVAANSYGSGGGYSLKQSLEEIGVKSGEFSQVTMSPGPAAFAALQSGKIDALVLWDAMLGAAENAGLKVRRIDISFQDRLAGMTIAANGAALRTEPKAIAGYCRAMTKALVFTKTNPQAAIRLFWKEFPQTKPTTGDEALQISNAAHILSRFLEMALQGMPTDGQYGQFIPTAWRNTAATFEKLGVLKGRATGEPYSTQLIDACNDFDRNAVVAQARAFPQ